jgi:hypothetical protein
LGHFSVLVVLRYELWFFAGGLAILVGYRLLTGAINSDCLLNSKTPGGSYSPARLQLLLFTLGSAIYYAYLCYQRKEFVPVPSAIQAALGGSNALYILRKAFDVAQTDA